MNLNPFNKENKADDTFVYTEDQLMARLRFFIGICLALTLTGIVFVVLYSIIFVTQPLNSMSPIDQKFFELIIPIATFLTGTLSGIMLASKDDKVAQMKALEAATTRPTVSPMPTPIASSPMPMPRSMGNPFPPSSGVSSPAPIYSQPQNSYSNPINTRSQVPQAPEPEL